MQHLSSSLPSSSKRRALVPTMGALHHGHLKLVEEAKKHAEEVVVSIFVNPLQFGVNEDFARYPRPLADDKALLEKAGADILYTPAATTLYPPGFATLIRVQGLSEVLCGAHRPGHFDGVATVVAKLFAHTKPHVALFGEKDYQQLAIIKRFTADLDVGIDIIGVSTVRDADGLALSSRNRYLSTEQREQASKLPVVLKDCLARLAKKPPQHVPILEQAAATLRASGFSRVDYLECRHRDTLALPPTGVLFPLGEYRLFVAAHLGTTRLIDNIVSTL
jgi:pantoate--beta-alanine ligase